MRRTLIAVAVVLLAVLSAPGIRFALAPERALPEVTVSLALPQSAGGDPMETTTRWVEPIESAIRSIGDVAATSGFVGPTSARITVRFRSGVDADLKAARLTSELTSLRAGLPEGGVLAVWPAGDSGDRAAAWLAVTQSGGAESAERVADELRALPGVRDVVVFGAREVEVEARLHRHSGLPAESVATSVLAELRAHLLGVLPIGGRSVSIISDATEERLQDARVDPNRRLGAISRIRMGRGSAQSISHLDGRRVVILQVMRDDDGALFRFDSALRRRARALGVEELSSEATDARRLLARLATGGLVASLLLAVGGLLMEGMPGLLLGLYPLLAACVALNLARVFDVRVDSQTMLAAAIAIAGCIPLAVLRANDGGPSRSASGQRRAIDRSIVAISFVWLLPVAAALGSGRLEPFFTPPARAFAVAALTAIVATSLIPVRRRPRTQIGGRRSRILLRRAISIALAAAALTYVLFSFFGWRLDPRRSGGSVDRERLVIHVDRPIGSAMTSTESIVADLERSLVGLHGIARVWSVIQPTRADIAVDLAEGFQSVAKRNILRLRLESIIRAQGESISIRDSFVDSPTPLPDELERRPQADEYGSYEVLVIGSDIGAMRRLPEQIATRLSRLSVPHDGVRAAWTEGTRRIELLPKPSTTGETSARMAAEIAAWSTRPAGVLMPDGRRLRVLPADAPWSDDDVPQRSELFTHVFQEGTIPALFTHRIGLIAGSVMREGGRFVLPIAIEVPGTYKEERIAHRTEIDRALSVMPLPSGVVLDRPSLEPRILSREKLRLFGLAAFLPLLLIALGLVVLGSIGRALVAAAPAIVAIAAASLALTLTSVPVDEIVLLAIAAASCWAMAISVPVVERAAGSTRRTYREARDSGLPLVIAALASVVLLGIAGSGVTAMRNGWQGPMTGAGAVLFVAFGGAAILPEALLLSLREARRRAGSVARAARSPSEWSESGRPVLAIDNVTKIYEGGVRALQRITVEIRPGVIGLLGPNGSGKTTLLRTITGLLAPTRGRIVFRGVTVTPENLVAFRRFVGFLPQEMNAYPGLTAAQFLDYWALERGMTSRRARIEETERLLSIVGLERHANRRVRDFSGGMRQRIGIAQALIGEPPLVVVDEPTTGLDIEARSQFREVVRGLGQDRIVIVSTHIASDLDATASRILLLIRGSLRWDGAPDALVASARGRVFEAVVPDSEARNLSRRHRITMRIRTPVGIRIRAVASIGESLSGNLVEPTLEEAYIAMASEGAVRLSSFSFLRPVAATGPRL